MGRPRFSFSLIGAGISMVGFFMPWYVISYDTGALISGAELAVGQDTLWQMAWTKGGPIYSYPWYLFWAIPMAVAGVAALIQVSPTRTRARAVVAMAGLLIAMLAHTTLERRQRGYWVTMGGMCLLAFGHRIDRLFRLLPKEPPPE